MTNIHGIKVYRGASSNIFFIVDDSFMFCWENEEEIESLYAIFDQLEHTSDQHKQPSKVQIFFSAKILFKVLVSLYPISLVSLNVWAYTNTFVYPLWWEERRKLSSNS